MPTPDPDALAGAPDFAQLDRNATARRSAIGVADLDNLFAYHAMDENQKHLAANIREHAKIFSRVILENTPQCADQTTAIRHIRDAMMTANAAIALKGQV